MGAGTFLSRRRFWEIRQLQGGADSRPPFSSLPSVPAWSQARLSSFCPQGGPLHCSSSLRPCFPSSDPQVFTLKSPPPPQLSPPPSERRSSLGLSQTSSDSVASFRPLSPLSDPPPSDIHPLPQPLTSSLQSFVSPFSPSLDHLLLSDLSSSFRASSLRLYPSYSLRLRTPSTLSLSLSALPNPLWAKCRYRPPTPSPA